jgi:anthranilate/para-aminobenzoate synthase component II
MYYCYCLTVLQILGSIYGASVVRHTAAHGKISRVRHDDSALWRGLGEAMSVVRYHSLVIDAKTVPECLRVTAWTDDPEQLVMAVAHKEIPHLGVQFHPGTCFAKHSSATATDSSRERMH